MVSTISSYIPSTSIFTARNAVKAVGGVLLLSGVAAGTGRLLQLGGARLLTDPVWCEAGRAAIIAGEKLFLVGKGAFLSVTVPIYTATWVVPKWIATTGIPQGAMLAREYLLIPAQELYHSTLLPASLWVWKEALVPAAKAIVEATEALKIPLEKVMTIAYQTLVVPAGMVAMKELLKQRMRSGMQQSGIS
jgi:hypothetical protein